MRVLLYNWVQFDDAERRGGGVRVYEQNLVDHLFQHTDHEVVVLSSGLEHDLFDKSFRFEQTPNAYNGRVRSFSAVNSPVLAPGQHSFDDPAVFDETTLPQWHEFLRREGPFDIVQFDTLEGIPMPWLRVHEALPEAKVGVYFHNYFPVCPQVNLWKRETEHCADYRDGADCVSCLVHEVHSDEVKRAHQISRVLRRTGIEPGGVSYTLAYKVYGRLKANRRRAEKLRSLVQSKIEGRRAQSVTSSTLQADEALELRVPESEHRMPVSLKLAEPTRSADFFRERRERTAALINAEADVVLATSERVGEVVAARGIDRDLIEVSYIGTKVANEVDTTRRRHKLQVPGQLTLAYLGYMRADKGFLWLLDALEQAPDSVLQKLRLVIGAKMRDTQTELRLEALANRMVDVLHINGYQHDELPQLLSTVDVGLVPVLWEDNLPQVAIEMTANGLPLVTSDRGGAQELGGHAPGFTFRAGDRDDFLHTVERLADGETPLDSFWDHAVELTSMQRHYRHLMDLYAGADRGSRTRA
jgi:glycosyltransferase involved in cell wall biosynthesis